MRIYEQLASYENAMVSLSEYQAAVNSIRQQLAALHAQCEQDVVVDCGNFRLRVVPA